MSDNFNKSKHSETLNSLVDMQESIIYSARRGVLNSAENIIASQEKRITELEADKAQLTALVDELRHQIAPLLSAINWAMGCNGEFRMRGTGDGSYYWRTELGERAGVTYNGEKYVIDAATQEQGK